MAILSVTPENTLLCTFLMQNFNLGIVKMSVISENPVFPNLVLPKTSVYMKLCDGPRLSVASRPQLNNNFYEVMAFAFAAGKKVPRPAFFIGQNLYGEKIGEHESVTRTNFLNCEYFEKSKS